RYGITATKKVGKAVQRNRARRLIRESFRQIYKEIPQNFDYVIVARGHIFSQKTTSLVPLLKKEIINITSKFENVKK
ncbi:MAG: ribonuclease P protein component, partial [Oscillospiraceae bacterium]